MTDTCLKAVKIVFFPSPCKVHMQKIRTFELLLIHGCVVKLTVCYKEFNNNCGHNADHTESSRQGKSIVSKKGNYVHLGHLCFGFKLVGSELK